MIMINMQKGLKVQKKLKSVDIQKDLITTKFETQFFSCLTTLIIRSRGYDD